MKSLTSKSLPYRKCKEVCIRLIEGGQQQINRSDLRRLISKYCAASPTMIKVYERRFVEYGFLIKQSSNPNIFQVNQNFFFSSTAREQITNTPKISEERPKQASINVSESDVLGSNTLYTRDNEQCKTVVYPVDGEKKVTCSFKGYRSIWQPFKEAVWADGFPDICYVLHIMISAYLSASREKKGRIDMSFPIGNMNFHVTINAPYIVQRPRRKIVYYEEE